MNINSAKKDGRNIAMDGGDTQMDHRYYNSNNQDEQNQYSTQNRYGVEEWSTVNENNEICIREFGNQELTQEKQKVIPKHVKNKLSYDSFTHRNNKLNEGGTNSQVQTAEGLNLMNRITSAEIDKN